MLSLRSARQTGHRRKFLTIIDETPECDRAVVYAANRAAHSDGGLVLLYVIEPAGFQGLLGVENVMRAEAMDDAEATLARYAERARAVADIDPELILREGKRADEIAKLIEDDRDIAILVLAAGTGTEGPGPLVASITGKGGGYPIPVTVVPDSLSDDDIAALT
jgi:nucleotide-binding universal stress UspA family protein